MNQILEWSPLIVFFVAFKLLGIYWATGALMAICVIVMLVHRLQTGAFKPMHVVTAAVAVVLGSATFLFHDVRFIQWKPTILLGGAAMAFLGSGFIGRQPLARRMLEGVFSEPLELTPQAWRVINALWAFWFALLAAANIYIAHNFSESVWVNFKVFGISVAMMIFMIPRSSGSTAGSRSRPPPPRAPDMADVAREERLRRRLLARFAPLHLSIEDESHHHAGHAGAAGGHSHYRVRIVAEAFRGVSAVARHRLVYAAVGDMIRTDIHALVIEALPPPAEP